MRDDLDRYLYRETVQSSGSGEGKVIRQSGKVGVYAHVDVTVRPMKRGNGIQISWEAGSAIPSRFAPAILEGVQDVLRNGIMAGMETVDVHASVENGSYHDVDSSSDAFREAAMLATTEAIRQAQPVLLEAVAQLTVAIPNEILLTLEESVISSGGRITNRQSGDQMSVVEARVPAPRSSDLFAKILVATDGRSTISLAIAGFETKPEPPDTVEEWVPAQ
jgi:elongation factor G